MANGDYTYTVSLTGTDGAGQAFSWSSSESITSGTTPRKITDLNIDSATEVNLLTIASVQSGIAVADIKKIIIKNLEATNFMRVRQQDDGAHAFDVKVKAGQIFTINNRSLNVHATAGAFAAFTDTDTIAAQFDSADGKIDLIVVGT